MSKLHIDNNQCRVYLSGNDAMLTLSEFKVIARLAANADEFVSYRELYDVVQAPGFIAGEGLNGYRGNVRTLVKRIRKKFGALDISTWDMIENYQAVGYRIRREHIYGGMCCPTCGQKVFKFEAVVVGKPTETVPPTPTPDYAKGVVLSE